jgi:hypothetical protein
MSTPNFKIKPGDVAIFVIGFLATDYIWYTKKPEYIYSIVWARVLGDKDDSIKQHGQLPSDSSGPGKPQDK